MVSAWFTWEGVTYTLYGEDLDDLYRQVRIIKGVEEPDYEPEGSNTPEGSKQVFRLFPPFGLRGKGGEFRSRLNSMGVAILPASYRSSTVLECPLRFRIRESSG